MVFPADHSRDNPWWRDRSSIERDPDLQRLRDQPARYDHPIPFAMDLDAVYTLRGPRQVGKSTLLKRIARELLNDRRIGARDLFFLDAEAMAIEAAGELREALEEFLDWSRSASPGTRKFLLLDEVTGVSDWGSAVRVLYRRGLLEDVTAIVTGSHSLDLKEGGETAPGRRGEEHGVELDWIMMPFAFRDFVLAHEPDLEGGLPAIDALEPRDAFEAASELTLYAESIRPLFDRYLLAGGYPHAMAAEATSERIPGSVYDLYRHAVTGQMKRAGHRESYFRELVAWAADRGLGHEFSWRDGSGETRIGSKDTVRRYLEDAEAMYLWHIVYRAHSATAPARALRSPKKLYPSDPFGVSWPSSGSGRCASSGFSIRAASGRSFADPEDAPPGADGGRGRRTQIPDPAQRPGHPDQEHRPGRRAHLLRADQAAHRASAAHPESARGHTPTVARNLRLAGL